MKEKEKKLDPKSEKKKEETVAIQYISRKNSG